MSKIVKKVLGEADEAEVNRYIQQIAPITQPFTREQQMAMTQNATQPIAANVAVELWSIIENDLDWINDHVSAAITGSDYGLTDIGLEPVGVRGPEVIIRVTGMIEAQDPDADDDLGRM